MSAKINYNKLAGASISSLVAYQPGKPISALERELGLKNIIKLASNESPYGPSPKVIEKISSYIHEISRYPLGDAFFLREAVSKKLGVSPERLVFGSGSNEIIELLFRTFLNSAEGEHVISPAPSFSVYGIIAQAMGSQCVWVPVNPDFSTDLDALYSAINEKTRIIFIANPNNPTGTYLNSKELKAFIDKVPQDIIIVMDEAYIEFADAPDFPNTLKWIDEYNNIVLMRTFSKAYCLAGLRIGYAICHKDCCEMLNRVRQPFNTNAIAQVAAIAALQDDVWLDMVVKNNIIEKNKLYKEFKKLGLPYTPTQANFIMVDVKDGKKVFESLLRKGVIVRFFGTGLEKYIRVSIGTEQENSMFIDALKEAMKEVNK